MMESIDAMELQRRVVGVFPEFMEHVHMFCVDKTFSDQEMMNLMVHGLAYAGVFIGVSAERFADITRLLPEVFELWKENISITEEMESVDDKARI